MPDLTTVSGDMGRQWGPPVIATQRGWSMAEQTPEARRDLEIKLITRAWKDEAFARELKSNPKAVVERELSVKLPANVEVKVLEETPNTIYLVLPEKPKAPQGELSDEQLATAAGGIHVCAANSNQNLYSIRPCGWGTGTAVVP